MSAVLGLALAVTLVAPSSAPSSAPLPDPRPAIAAPAVAMAPGMPPPRPGPAAASPAAAPPAPSPEQPPAPAVLPAPLPGRDEMVCLDPRLTGDPRPDVIEVSSHACGVFEPVRVRSVAGMRLKPPVLVDCTTARRLADWLDGVVRIEAQERLGGRVAVVRTMGSYACRTQNHVAGGRLSEHARGRAVDIGGFTLTSGKEIRVERDWVGPSEGPSEVPSEGPSDDPSAGPSGSSAEGAFLRSVWAKACGPFATVLGPEADRHHLNHLHLDTAPGRDPYCR